VSARYGGLRADDKSARLTALIERLGTVTDEQDARSIYAQAYNVARGNNGRKARLERAYDECRARLEAAKSPEQRAAELAAIEADICG
jgi:hypothetical protein